MNKEIFQLKANVVDQVEVAEDSFVLSLHAPQIASVIQPGQFIQIRPIEKSDPLLPRPFSIYRVRNGEMLDILYEVVGRGTALMSGAKKGTAFSIFGPLGNQFTYPTGKTLSFLIGGGVGLAPFYDLSEALLDPHRGKQKKENITVLLGARHRKKIFCEADFKHLGVSFEVATDDGSYGFRGLITELLEKKLTSSKGASCQLYACGPKPMLKAIAHLATEFQVPCEMSVDAHMPCGYGICFGCAIQTKTKKESSPSMNGHCYKLVCTDGPVFSAEELLWE